MLDLHWTEPQFWRSTPFALVAAIEVSKSRTPEGRAELKRQARERRYAKFFAEMEQAGLTRPA